MKKEEEILMAIQHDINHAKADYPDFRENEISDGYHTFAELYEFRKIYHALLFNDWATEPLSDKLGREAVEDEGFSTGGFKPKYDVHKSKLHYDGEIPFGNPKWFIVVAMLPDGQISNHYKKEDWDLFKIPEAPKAKYEFDGHTPKDVLERLKDILK